MPPVVSRSRSDFGQIHCLPSRAANAFQSGAILPCSAFLAASKTYNLRVFIAGKYSETPGNQQGQIGMAAWVWLDSPFRAMLKASR